MIRAATPADAADIARVQVETWRAAYAGILPDDFLAALSVGAGASRWADLIGDPDRVTYVWGDPVRGFAAAGPPRDADLAAGTGEVYAVYVHPAAQRQGAGKALMATTLGWLGENGYHFGALWVLTGNATGRAFYRATGWRPDGSARSIDIGGALADEVRYVREVSPETATG